MAVPKVGVSIAVHNDWQKTRACLEAVSRSVDIEVCPVVVDDGGTDGTWEMLKTAFPEVKAIRGDGNLWWTGGNNRAIEACLKAGCDYVLILNPDVVVEPDTITKLIEVSRKKAGAIAAALVVDYDHPEDVWWAGSQWGPLKPWLPVWTNRYLYRSGTKVSAIPVQPYVTSEAHGRAVLIPRGVFDRVGLYDERCLPHYGADTDFSHRARRMGYSIYVVTTAPVRLHVNNTGLHTTKSAHASWQGYWRYLTARKNGDALRVWWHLVNRYVPKYAFLPTYLFILGLNTLRYWQKAASRS